MFSKHSSIISVTALDYPSKLQKHLARLCIYFLCFIVFEYKILSILMIISLYSFTENDFSVNLNTNSIYHYYYNYSWLSIIGDKNI